jgi:hypothetical protein
MSVCAFMSGNSFIYHALAPLACIQCTDTLKVDAAGAQDAFSVGKNYRMQVCSDYRSTDKSEVLTSLPPTLDMRAVWRACHLLCAVRQPSEQQGAGVLV